MTGAPPYGVQQSPTQQPRFTAYSPPNKNHPYYPNNEQYQQHPAQTPATFPPPTSLARSPHFGHAPSPLPTTLPPLNGSAPPPPPPPPHSEAPQQYQAHSSSSASQFSLPRPYAGSVMPGNSSASYNHATSAHAHPTSRPDGLPQSPKKEPEQSFDMRGNGAGYPSQSPMMREPPRPASPKETVRCDLCYPGKKRERERERESVCVCVCVYVYANDYAETCQGCGPHVVRQHPF